MNDVNCMIPRRSKFESADVAKATIQIHAVRDTTCFKTRHGNTHIMAVQPVPPRIATTSVTLGATMAREDVSASALQSAVHSKKLREKARKEEKPKLRKQCRPPPTHDRIR